MKKEMNRFLVLLLVTGCVLMITTVTASATNYYVSVDGNDVNTGTLSSPFKTINKGVDKCDGGDTVYVRSGTYAGDIEIENSGTPNSYNTLTNYENDNVIIKNSNIYDHGIIVDANYWIIEGFEITNTWHPIKVCGGQHDIEMKNLECHFNGYSLLMQDGSYNILIEDCEFYDPYSDSSNFVGLRGEDDDVSHHIAIRDCSFDGCIHNSINFYSTKENQNYGGTTDVLIEGCSFSNGRQVAIFTNWHGVTRMIVRDCYFDHYARGIQAVMYDCLVEDCTVEDNGNFFIYTQADDKSDGVVVRDIVAESGDWGSKSFCVDLKYGKNFEVYNVKATGFSETSRPKQIKDPRIGTPDASDNIDDSDEPDDVITKEEMIKATNDYLLYGTITKEELIEIMNRYYGV